MADIFISYAKPDWHLALTLSEYLKSEGWSVWWDKSLTSGEIFRDEIMRQLATAKAVIVIWTERSVKSDWVCAEAERWSRKSEQGDKWSFCLTAGTLCPANQERP